MIDFLIVGGGFSGMHVATQLQQQNKSFHLIDPCNFTNATAVSAGIINPVTGRKFATQWNMNELIPLAAVTYAHLEEKLNIRCLYTTSVFKIHKSEAALEEWLQVKAKDQLSDYIVESPMQQYLAKFIDYRYGGITIQPAFHVNTSTLLTAFYSSISEQLFKTTFNYSTLIIGDDYFTYKDTHYQHIIFCEGVQAMQNPFFDFIAFKPAKGECFIVEIPNFSTEQIIMKGIMLVPLQKNQFWVGATNTWNDLIPEPTQQGAEELTASLQALLKVPYTILEHKTAIRPTIRDRAPVVGKHPSIKNMFVLNGMGTKGTAHAPYYAQQLIAHILQNAPINAEANVNRF